MSNTILKNRIEKCVNNLVVDDNIIIVIKGMPFDLIDTEAAQSINYDEIIKNKFSYMMSIVGKRKFITYEEFLLLSDFIVSQYSTVYILTNNIYLEQYPLNLYCSSKTIQGIITHFEESDSEEDDDREVGNIEEIISLFVGVKDFNGYLIGAYCDDKALSNPKIEAINIFEECEENIQKVADSDDFVDLIEESDYVSLIKKVFDEPDEIYIRISNYTGDFYKLKSHLSILAKNWSDWTDFYIVQAQEVEESFEHRSEYTEILKKYWGHGSFRNIEVYDVPSLEEGKKKVVKISQENIISNLVDQVEKCSDNNKAFRDMFVTAPTGAGKSVMFQIPAIYLAEKHNLLTIVISPLIGLMNDQVKNLEVKNYKAAKTINSDISPIIKQDIMEKVADSHYHILYISPETLLSRSDVEQLIGDRTIGMIVIDEAHIVTTWGKQFRPDYWYLGDHIRKLRKKQLERKGRSFVVATFTATAIYHGFEDMYTETVNSLHMLNPITYLGYVKRDDIDITITRKVKENGQRSEYELDKDFQIAQLVERAIIMNKKTLIYFPTIALINRCYEALRCYKSRIKLLPQVSIYHGSLDKDKKAESYEKFYNGEKLVMLATKAFGMGIDIDNIEIVAHFAPTGNVCDYVQEVGRAARRPGLNGEAVYQYDSRDFKHINRLHGLSTIQKYQLIEVIKKITELYSNSLKNGGRNNFTRRRNSMLLDAENFSYIFGTPISDEDSDINKVKTALLIIQKDFENRIGFSPINVRPIPLFSFGYFKIREKTQEMLKSRYYECLEEIEPDKNICRINLQKIWDKDYRGMSFPQFKYLVYSNNSNEELDCNFVDEYPMTPALCVNIEFGSDYKSLFEKSWNVIQSFINQQVLLGKHTSIMEITNAISQGCNISEYKARAITEVIIASMDSYRKNFSRSSTPIAIEKATKDGNIKYQFNVAVNSYFKWVENKFNNIIQETVEGELYLVNDNGIKAKEISVVLGILESLDVLSFKMIGGESSQLYIYINQIQSLINIINSPGRYDNRLLDTVGERHLVSVKMLTYLYEGNFTSDETWDIIENYFLGIIPETVKKNCRIENPAIDI